MQPRSEQVHSELEGDAAKGAELLDETRRILDTSDAALRRFARDLHDGAQQRFSTAVMNLQFAQGEFSVTPERAEQHLRVALDEAESGLDALRALVAHTHPPILAHLGLNAAVVSMVDGLPIPVSLDVTQTRLVPALEETVYYFVSETLANMVKHADATGAAVQIAVGEMLLTAEVSDDGTGGARLESSGTGLLGVLDRVLAFGGDLTLASPPSGGTVVRAVFPLTADPV
jgi:signal transduction histidine kinase